MSLHRNSSKTICEISGLFHLSDDPASTEKLWEHPLLVTLGMSIQPSVLDVRRMSRRGYCFSPNKSMQDSGKQYLRVDKSPAEVWDDNWRSRLERRVPNHFVLDGSAVRTQRALGDRAQHGSINFQVLIQSVDLDPIHLLSHLSRIQLYGQRDVTEDVLWPKRNVLATDGEQLDVIHCPAGVPVWGNKCHPDCEGLWSQGIAEFQLQVAALRLRTGRGHRVLVDCWVGTPCSDTGFTRLLNIRVPWKERSKDRALKAMGLPLASVFKDKLVAEEQICQGNYLLEQNRYGQHGEEEYNSNVSWLKCLAGLDTPQHTVPVHLVLYFLFPMLSPVPNDIFYSFYLVLYLTNRVTLPSVHLGAPTYSLASHSKIQSCSL